MHERRFHRAIEVLRSPERLARMEVDKAVSAALDGNGGSLTVLDVGTGSAVFAEEFAKRGLVVTGVDANPEMLPVAKGFVPSGTFLEGTAELLPCKTGEFDLVFMGLVLHETDDRQAAMNEAGRVAKKRLAIFEWPYHEQEFGPGMEERIPAYEIQEMGKQAGFIKFSEYLLTNNVVYLLDK